MSPPGMVSHSLFQLVALRKTETSKCCFLAFDVSFQERSGEHPQSLLQTIMKTLESFAIGMSHL